MPVFVFDSSCLCPFALADRLDTLRRFTEGSERRTTRAVLDEIRAGVTAHPALEGLLHLDWLEAVPIDGLPELIVFSDLRRRFGHGKRDIGEASVLAWAEVHGAVAVLDDQTGRIVAQERRIAYRGTLGILALAIRNGRTTLPEAAVTVDLLRAAGARLPCDGEGFVVWCGEHGLL
ncbi:MAG: hypothetical protein RBU45_16335 [Myxococcota bacterium]|jgi:predicted nucleic acid-binding protein|nr:hypothetical protein [Myxococcota bacterium]